MKCGKSFLIFIAKLQSAKVAGDTKYIVTRTLIIVSGLVRTRCKYILVNT